MNGYPRSAEKKSTRRYRNVKAVLYARKRLKAFKARRERKERQSRA